MILAGLRRAQVRILDAIAVAGPTKDFGAKGKGDGAADVISHFLGDHAGIDGAPVPLVLVGHVEPGDAVEDDGLNLDAGGAVLVPDGLNPEVEVDVVAVFIYEGGLRHVAEGVVEARGGEVLPFRREGFRPGGHEEVDADGVFEEVVDFAFGFGVAGEEEGRFGAGAEVGDVDSGGGEAGGGVLR